MTSTRQEPGGSGHAPAPGPHAASDAGEATAPLRPTPRPPLESGTRFEQPQADDAANAGGTEILSPDDVEQVTSSNLGLGSMVGERYRIVSELGAGGMGRVYRARDLTLQRDVAIKVMRESFLETADAETRRSFEQRFDAEAVLPAALSHPNIVAIHDRGVFQALPYLVMEFLPDARSLADLIREAQASRTFVDEGLVKAIFLQAAAALRAVHSRPGTWHRDIKLDNILMCDLPGGGQIIKLIDFGIAHEPDSERTLSGMVLGTPRYLAPEFFEYNDHDVPVEPDHRADLFALGVVLYQVLVLKRPYEHVSNARDAGAAFRSTTNLPRPPSAWRPGLEPGWDCVAMKLLERKREDRYQSAADLIEDLGHLDALPSYTGPGARLGLATGSARKPIEVAAAASKDQHPPPGSAEVPEIDPEAPEAAPLSAFGMVPAPQHGAGDAGDNDGEVPAPAEHASAHAPSPQSLASDLPPGEPSSAASPSRASGLGVYSAAWTAKPDDAGRKGRRLAILAGSAFLAVLFGFGAVVKGLELLAARAEGPVDEWRPPPAEHAKREQAVWMKDIQEPAPLFKESPVAAAAPSGAASPSTSAPPPGPTGGVSSLSPASRKPREASSAGPGPAREPAPEDVYAAIYGTANKDLSGGTVLMRPEEAAAVSAAAATARGKLVSARLTTEIADRPAGAAVIARVVKPLTLGTTRIPAGTEAHGRVVSSSGLRIFCDFEFFRLQDGTIVNFKGSATDPQGRQGIAGKKLVDVGTATGVAASVGGNLVDQAGTVLAENVDNQLARTGVTSSFSEAGRRSDRLSAEEAAVVASKGTAFSIYVQSID